jgi:hypothetical protein
MSEPWIFLCQWILVSPLQRLPLSLRFIVAYPGLISRVGVRKLSPMVSYHYRRSVQACTLCYLWCGISIRGTHPANNFLYPRLFRIVFSALQPIPTLTNISRVLMHQSQILQTSVNQNRYNVLCIQELNNTPASYIFQCHPPFSQTTTAQPPGMQCWKLAGYWWEHLNVHLTPLDFVCNITWTGKKYGGISFRVTLICQHQHINCMRKLWEIKQYFTVFKQGKTENQSNVH